MFDYLYTLTKDEVLTKFKEFDKLKELYFSDGTPKEFPCGVTDVSYSNRSKFNDEQVNIINEWVNGITKFVIERELDFYEYKLDFSEIERLGEMLGCEVDVDYEVIYINDDAVELYLKDLDNGKYCLQFLVNEVSVAYEIEFSLVFKEIRCM